MSDKITKRFPGEGKWVMKHQSSAAGAENRRHREAYCRLKTIVIRHKDTYLCSFSSSSKCLNMTWCLSCNLEQRVITETPPQ